MDKKSRAWMMAICGTLMTGTAYAVILNCFSIYIVPICSTLGFSRAGYNLALTIIYIFYMVGSILSGSVYQKVNLKVMMEVAAVGIPVFYFLSSYASALWQFYALSAAMGFLLPYISFAAFSVVIHDWFEEKEGTAIGIAFMGSGIGGMILNVLCARWIENLGYQNSFRLSAILTAVVTIPCAFFLVKENHPNFGVAKKDGLGLSLFDRSTLKLSVLAFLVGFGITILSQTMPPHLVDMGFDPMYAASMNAAFMGVLCLSKVVVGAMFDRLGIWKTMATAIFIGILGAISYYFASHRLLHPMMVLGAAMATSLGSVSFPVLARVMCPPEAFAHASGNASAIDFLGSAVAPLFMNLLFDMVGSYRPGYIVSVLMLLFVLVLIPRRGTK